ncbi:helix-turn-helix domain-containing protein [Companilactobacillus paralimentarius]|uniref:helix-turn-helix domain-containing protein n=1 Tax=Companilactobacillus paralimentarius TaxID=83526 RepID=UPI001265ED01|nr:helix-turn-helix transcriptional regulator [Companilactobacillus paralimentarius]QFR68476.1 helix-turn-helix domain-containing protein [Companilactobacillus paralimentarius]
MTQQQVADKLGITRANYSHIENGRNEPDDDTTVKIAQLFNVSTDFLLGNDVDPTWATKKTP